MIIHLNDLSLNAEIQIRTIAKIVHGYRIEASLLKKSDERLAQSTLRTRDATVFTS